MVADLNLFKEEIGWKGEVGGDTKPVKATVLWVAAMHPPPHLHYSPKQLWATMFCQMGQIVVSTAPRVV